MFDMGFEPQVEQQKHKKLSSKETIFAGGLRILHYRKEACKNPGFDDIRTHALRHLLDATINWATKPHFESAANFREFFFLSHRNLITCDGSSAQLISGRHMNPEFFKDFFPAFVKIVPHQRGSFLCLIFIRWSKRILFIASCSEKLGRSDFIGGEIGKSWTWNTRRKIKSSTQPFHPPKSILFYF